MNNLVMSFLGFCFGCLVAGGVFTDLFVVGLIPRFACKTGTARYEIWYEECIIFGVLIGALVSIFDVVLKLGTYMQMLPEVVYLGITYFIMLTVGLFSGIFVGCLALAAAELLDSVPIFARRIKLKGGFNYIIFSVALGKLAGSLYYFLMGFHLQM